MQGKRTDRVAHLIQMELAQLLLTRMKDPRLQFVTVTHVSVAADLKSAMVFYSVLGDKPKQEAAQAALEKGSGFLQRGIGTALQLRYTPKLHFRFDDSLEKGFEIDKLIHKIHQEEDRD